MADEDDETFPPETQILPTEFAFREFGRFPLISDENNCFGQTRNSLLAAANTYGLVFVGYPAGFKVYTDSSFYSVAISQQQSSPDILVDVPLKCPPHWLAVSSDNLTLVVCISGEKVLQALFFDVRNLINEAKPTKTPFFLFPLSKTCKDAVSSLHWNPSLENTQYLAICLSSGAFHMLSVTDDVKEIGFKATEFGACSTCWSPRGKQVMIGKRDGSMQQYTPAMEIRRTIPVYDAVERPVKVDDILWLSTLQVAFSYTHISEDGDWQPSLFIINLPPAKEQNKSPSWRNYEDPCYGVVGTRPSHFMLSFVDKWNLFVVGSSDASETAIIGKNKTNGVWEIWNLDDSCRAQLPMEDNNEEPYPLGVAILYTARDRIVVDDTRECGPMPVFAMLSCDGHVSLFHMINLQSQDDFPDLIIEPKTLTPEGERASVVNKLGGLPMSKSTVDSGMALLSDKPSLPEQDPVTKAPSVAKALNETSLLSTTPLQGGGIFGSGKSAAVKLAPRALAFPVQSTPALPTSGRISEQNIESPFKIPLPLDAKPVVKKPLGKTFSVAPNKVESLVEPPIPTGAPAPTKPQQEPLNLNSSSISSLSATSPRIDPAHSAESQRVLTTTTTTTTTTKRKKTINKQEDKLSEPTLSSQVSSGFIDGLTSEVMDFEAELQGFFNESMSVGGVVATLGGDNEKRAMMEELESLSKFGKAIAKTSEEQHDEIKSIRSVSLESYAAVQNVGTHRKRIENPAYRSALYARPLDMSDQRKMKDIRSLYHHIKESIREVNKVLDDQWDRFMSNKKSSNLHKSKRRMEIEERETMSQAVLNQTKILHNQEMNLLLLGQQLDKLRLLNTSWQLSYVSDRDQADKTTSGDGEDLPTLASSLISLGKNADSIRSTNEVTSRPPQSSRISPQKAHQLSEYLASRKTSAIRSFYGRKSKFIAPTFARSRPPDGSKDSSHHSRLSFTTKSDVTTTASDESLTESENDPSVSTEGATPGYYLPVTNENAALTPVDGRGMMDLPSNKPPNFTHPLHPLTRNNLTGSSSSIPGTFTAQQGGSATFTYGSPESSFPPQTSSNRRFDPSQCQAEASSNLNYPPNVVNIKDLSHPQVVNPLLAPRTFEAKSSVPQGVADEVQRMLNTVHAERSTGLFPSNLPPQNQSSNQPPSQPSYQPSQSSNQPPAESSNKPPSHQPSQQRPSQPSNQLPPESSNQPPPNESSNQPPVQPLNQPPAQASPPQTSKQPPTQSLTQPPFHSLEQVPTGLNSGGIGVRSGSFSRSLGSAGGHGSFTMKFPSAHSTPILTSSSSHVRRSASDKYIFSQQSANKMFSVKPAASASGTSATQRTEPEPDQTNDAPPEGAPQSGSVSPAPITRPSKPSSVSSMLDPKKSQTPDLKEHDVKDFSLNPSIVTSSHAFVVGNAMNKTPLTLKPDVGSALSKAPPTIKSDVESTLHKTTATQQPDVGSPLNKTPPTLSKAPPTLQQDIYHKKELSVGSTGTDLQSSSGLAEERTVPDVSEKDDSHEQTSSVLAASLEEQRESVESVEGELGENNETLTATDAVTVDLSTSLTSATEGRLPTTAFNTTSNTNTSISPVVSSTTSGGTNTTGSSGFSFKLPTAYVDSSGRALAASEFGGSAVKSTTTTSSGVFGVSTTRSSRSPFAAPTSTSGGTPFETATTTSGGSLFGSLTTGSGGSSFGTATTTSGGSLFGSLTTGSGGSSFGTATTTSGGSLFGSLTTGSGGSSFGTATTASGGSSFGTATTTSGGLLFGSLTTGSGGSSFGTATTTSGGSLFGSLTTGSGGSSFGTAITTSGGSLFGSFTTASGGSPFGTTATTSGGTLFGTTATTSSGSLFGTTATTSGGTLFGTTATTSGGTLFGTTATTSGGSLFGIPSNNADGSSFGAAPSAFGSSAFSKPAFGAPSAFGTNSASASSTFGSGGGGGFLSGLGSTPTQPSGSNPFASGSSAPSSENKSLFGGTGSSPFASGFGQASGGGGGFGSSSDATKSFGFVKPATGGFGTAPVFGSPPSFGAQPAFGSAPQFGSGTPAPPPSFGSQAAQGSGFGTFASNNSNTPGFGSLAQQNGSSGGFGSFGNQQSTGFSGGFGSAPAPSSKPSFTGWR